MSATATLENFLLTSCIEVCLKRCGHAKIQHPRTSNGLLPFRKARNSTRPN